MMNIVAIPAAECGNLHGQQIEPIAIDPQEAIAHGGTAYSVRYEPRTRTIALLNGRKRIVLSSVVRNFDPTIVGAERVIGLLPEHLQLYRNANVLVYVSAIRTSGGDGGGYCGGGSETFLNFLDVSNPKPTQKASLLIASCEHSIELYDQDLPKGILGLLLNINGRLAMQFLSYGDREGSLTAVVSVDFRTLEFQ
ncbi:hypothetical protein LK542_11380 [Massilia sp. IC2-477]|nr:hypothetical protein [Massilia sp. IC2-477]